MNKLSVVVNVNLEFECPDWVQTRQQAVNYAQTRKMPSEYVSESFEIYAVFNGENLLEDEDLEEEE